MRLAVAFLASMLIAGCSGPAMGPDVSPSPALPTPSPIPTVESTASHSPVPTVSETATPTVRPTPTSSPRPTPRPTPKPTSVPTASPLPHTLAQLVGQKLVVKLSGTTPSADILGRIGRGEIGGVILFGANVTTPAALVALTARLQEAAVDGGQRPVLICTDQEGGTIKRIPWAPPTLSVPDMGEIGLAATARQQGAETGSALLGLGINCDLGPVADVPGSIDSFMYIDGRTWSFDVAATTTLSNAFARGLESSGVAPAMKHFPGIGLATLNTDSNAVAITATASDLAAGLEPYRGAIARHIPMIMLSNATYPAYDPDNGAGWSRAISHDLLRDDLGFSGVTITDSLSGTAAARGATAEELAVEAAFAGTDMILITGSEAATSAVYDALLAAARDGTIPRSTLEASYARIGALKNGL